MKKRSHMLRAGLFGAAAALLLVSQNLSPFGPKAKGAEEPSSPLKMSITSLDAKQTGVFRVDLENIGNKDLVLNLGMMLGNGSILIPDAISLILVDSKGESKELLFSDPFIAGRIDDYIVPLRAGSAYSLRLSLEDYSCAKTNESKISLQAGEYRIHAVLTARGAQTVNSDMEGMKVMNFWKGTVSSAPITVTVAK
ncbi:MAG: hypothetical protein WC655_19840 [Candidatus Hydrogenedentales bacterium]|jgi:hypothetical protein